MHATKSESVVSMQLRTGKKQEASPFITVLYERVGQTTAQTQGHACSHVAAPLKTPTVRATPLYATLFPYGRNQPWARTFTQDGDGYPREHVCIHTYTHTQNEDCSPLYAVVAVGVPERLNGVWINFPRAAGHMLTADRFIGLGGIVGGYVVP